MTRAEFLRLALGASAGWCVADRFSNRLAAEQSPAAVGDGIEARAADTVRAYDAQGIHRTATEVDNRSAAWLRGLAASAGATVATETFSLGRVDLHQAFVQVGDRRIDALPLFDGGFTDAAGLRGRLGPGGSDAEFPLVRLDQPGISSEGQRIADLRRSRTHRAIIVVTEGAKPGLTPTNAGAFAAPYGIPALQVGSDALAWLEARAAEHAPAHVVAHATRTPAAASNVVATIAGRRPELSPVIAMTPRSGWWQCAAERGGGLVCWLEVIRRVAASRPARQVLFVASSGHELGHLGLDAFIEHRPGIVKAAHAWMHFGANIGAAGGRPRLQASSEEMSTLAVAAMATAGASVEQRVPIGNTPGGEARNIHVGGGRYVSLLGSSPFFHSAEDRWPTAVDVPTLARFARAFSNLAVTLANVG
jgi:hypothetical protein